MDWQENRRLLKAPFEPEDHVKRQLPGGGEWYFVPWQRIRDRIDDVCEDWAVSFSDPLYLDKYCVIQCTITIAGRSRSAPGNAEIELISSTGKDMSRGTPVERAVADAFKNAAEQFGVCAYLDAQAQDKREFMVRYMHSKGDYGAAQTAKKNGWLPSNQPTTQQKEERREETAKTETAAIVKKSKDRLITDPQAKRFYAIAKGAGYTDKGVKSLLSEHGCFADGDATSKAISAGIYDLICEQAGNHELAEVHNQSASQTVESMKSARQILNQSVLEEMNRICWNQKIAQAYVRVKYQSDRVGTLDDDQLLEFLNHLKGLEPPTDGEVAA